MLAIQLNTTIEKTYNTAAKQEGMYKIIVFSIISPHLFLCFYSYLLTRMPATGNEESIFGTSFIGR